MLLRESELVTIDEMKGVIFDLDDTLVSSSLNFRLIKQQINCPENADILAFIDTLSVDEKRRAESIVLHHELSDAFSSSWMPGAKSFIESLHNNNIPTAIVTRNCKKATTIKLRRNDIAITTVITREDAPAKPDPTALKMIANNWQLDTAEIAYIGDFDYDIQAAHNAQMHAFLYTKKSKKECAINYVENLNYKPAKACK